MGHFETKSDAFSMRVYRSGPPAGADVLALGNQGRRARLVPLFTPPPSSFSSGHHLEHVASRSSAADDERRQAKRQPCRQAHGRGEDPLAMALTAAAWARRRTAV